MEVWAKCEEFENYSISSIGNLRNDKTNRILKVQPNNKGAFKYTFPENKQRLIHRLMAKAFLLNPDNLDTVDHINRNAGDNRLENLRWITQSNNIRNYTKAEGKSSKFKGVGFHKPTKKFRAFVKFDGKAKTIGTYETEKEAVIAYNDFIRFHHLEEFTPLNILEE